MDTQPTPNTEPIQKLLQELSTHAVFGPPITQNGITIIPVARVSVGFGYGGGYGRGGEAGKPNEIGEGGGGGGGAGGRATPCGFIRITDTEVKYESIDDETRIPLAGIAMVAWIVFWITATIRVIAKGVSKTRQLQWKVAQAEVNHERQPDRHREGKAK